MQDWDSGKRVPPVWVVTLLGYKLRKEKLLKESDYSGSFFKLIVACALSFPIVFRLYISDYCRRRGIFQQPLNKMSV